MWSNLYSLIYSKFREYRNKNMLNNSRRNNQPNPESEKFYRTNDPMCSTSKWKENKENCYKFKRERKKKLNISNKWMQFMDLVKILIPTQHKKIFLRKQNKDWMLDVIEK